MWLEKRKEMMRDLYMGGSLLAMVLIAAAVTGAILLLARAFSERDV